jgi:hypothetical protein
MAGTLKGVDIFKKRRVNFTYEYTLHSELMYGIVSKRCV